MRQPPYEEIPAGSRYKLSSLRRQSAAILLCGNARVIEAPAHQEASNQDGIIARLIIIDVK